MTYGIRAVRRARHRRKCTGAERSTTARIRREVRRSCWPSSRWSPPAEYVPGRRLDRRTTAQTGALGDSRPPRAHLGADRPTAVPRTCALRRHPSRGALAASPRDSLPAETVRDAVVRRARGFARVRRRRCGGLSAPSGCRCCGRAAARATRSTLQLRSPPCDGCPSTSLSAALLTSRAFDGRCCPPGLRTLGSEVDRSVRRSELTLSVSNPLHSMTALTLSTDLPRVGSLPGAPGAAAGSAASSAAAIHPARADPSTARIAPAEHRRGPSSVEQTSDARPPAHRSGRTRLRRCEVDRSTRDVTRRPAWLRRGTVRHELLREATRRRGRATAPAQAPFKALPRRGRDAQRDSSIRPPTVIRTGRSTMAFVSAALPIQCPVAASAFEGASSRLHGEAARPASAQDTLVSISRAEACGRSGRGRDRGRPDAAEHMRA